MLLVPHYAAVPCLTSHSAKAIKPDTAKDVLAPARCTASVHDVSNIIFSLTTLQLHILTTAGRRDSQGSETETTMSAITMRRLDTEQLMFWCTLLPETAYIALLQQDCSHPHPL